MSRATGMSRSTLQDAVGEVDPVPKVTGRVRRPGRAVKS